MASRVNIRLLFIVFVVLSTAVGVIGAVWYLQRRGDATRHATAAEQLIVEGRYEEALRFWQRALGRDNTNPEYMERWLDTLAMIHPDNRGKAEEFYQQLVGIYKHRSDHLPTEVENHKELFSELLHSARLSQASPYWRTLLMSANETLQRMPVGVPGREWADLYRGITLTDTQLAAELREDEVAEGVAAIESFLELHPENDLAWASLLDYYARLAHEMDRSGLGSRAREMRAKADETYAAALEAVSDGPELHLAAIRYKLFERARDPEAVADEEIRRLAERMIASTAEYDDAWVIAESAAMIARCDFLEDQPQQIELLNRAIELHPDRLDFKILKSRWHYAVGEHDAAEAAADEVIEMEPLPVSFLAIYQPEMRRRAASTKVDICLRRWEGAPPTERDARLAELEAATEALTAIVADPENNPIAQRAQAKVAFAKRDYSTAARLFDTLARTRTDAIADYGDVELFQYAAICLEQEGSIGRALDYVEQALEIQPDNMNVSIQRARLLTQMKRFVEAQEEVDQVIARLQRLLRREPENPAMRGYIVQVEQIRAAIEQRADAQLPSANREARTAIETAQELLMTDNFEGARQAITDALREKPEDLLLLNGLVRTEIAAGRIEEAKRLTERALELAPGNRSFEGIKASLNNEDPLDQITAFCDAVYADPTDRAIEKLVATARLARQHANFAARAEAGGRTEIAAEARDIATRAEAAVPGLEAEVASLAGEDSRFVEYRFVRAIIDGDLDAAEVVVEEAKRSNADGAGGALYEGRLATARKDSDAAIKAFERAVERADFSAQAWKMLAIAYQQAGRIRDALNAYEQAYRNNPNDVITARAYAALLTQSGEPQRALTVLSEARRASPADIALRNQLLALEQQFGDKGKILRARISAYKETPRDNDNATALVLFLSENNPTRETLLDFSDPANFGAERFSFDRWSRISAGEKRRVIAAERQWWNEQIDKILEGMATGNQRNLRWYQLKANSLFYRGQVADGEALLRDYVAEQETDADRVSAMLALGQYFLLTNQRLRAEAIVREAMPLQDESQRRAQHVLGGLMFEAERYEEAVENFEQVAEANPGTEIELQIVESLQRLGRLDEARSRLRRAVEQYGEDYRSLLLEAAILDAEVKELWTAGRDAEAEARFEELLATYVRAAGLDSTEPMPHVLRARSLHDKYRHTRNAVLLEDALAALAQADGVQDGFAATSLTRAQVLELMGNSQAVITELTDVLEQTPGQNQVRIVLIQALLRQGRDGEAIDAAAEGVRQNPTSPEWPEQLGDLLRQYRTDLPGAGKQYEESIAIRPSARVLRKMCEILLEVDPAQPEKVKELAQEHPDLFRDAPFLRANLARAKSRLGDREGALADLKASYGILREAIANGQTTMGSLTGWYGSLRSLYRLNEPAEAEAFVMEISGDEPTPVDLRMLATFWIATFNLKDFEDYAATRAQELLKRAAEICPEEEVGLMVALYADLGVYQLMAGEHEAALASFEKVLAIEPENSVALNNIAFVLGVKLDRPQDALSFAKRAAEMRPSDWAALDTLGWTHYMVGNLEEAESFLRRSIAIETKADNCYHLAKVLVDRGELDRAQRNLQQAAESDPDRELLEKINELADDIRSKRAGSR